MHCRKIIGAFTFIIASVSFHCRIAISFIMHVFAFTGYFIKESEFMETISIYGCYHQRENDTRRSRRNS